MPSFIHQDFLLTNAVARRLFHEVAQGLPVVDYHNHLDPVALVHNHRFTNITELLVTPDPYKHRAMRIHGIPENGITGAAADREKFNNWAATFPATWGNPLHHWNCLELKRLFGIDELLSPANASAIWDQTGQMMAAEAYTSQGILTGYGVDTLCTSDDPLQDLTPHRNATLAGELEVLPSLRGDQLTEVGRSSFLDFVRSLGKMTGFDITDLDAYLAAIDRRLATFQEAGCLLADHALNSGFRFRETDRKVAADHFQAVLGGEPPSREARNDLFNFLLVTLGERYARLGWGLQLHVGAQRKTSTRLRELAGSAGGYASIGKAADIESIAVLLDSIERKGGLPDIILYTLNPADNAAFGSLTGSFAEGGTRGKVQFGPAWWYNDHLAGIRAHLDDLAHYGLLRHFIGMTTDSRSFASFSRHEYFRRILCNLLGEWVAEGRIPADGEWLDEAVRDICYNNAKNWLNKKKTKYAN